MELGTTIFAIRNYHALILTHLASLCLLATSEILPFTVLSTKQDFHIQTLPKLDNLRQSDPIHM